jgi:membrane protease YdiL (CAAX protease family)
VAEPVTTEVVAPPPIDDSRPIASPIHLMIVLAVMAFLSFAGAADANTIAHAPSFNRSIFYIVTILFEWLMLGVVVLGVRLHRSPLSTVFGERWHSVREVARDVGIATVFWLVAAIILSATFGPSTETISNDVVRAMLPNGVVESSLWIVLSVTAGICEEAIFRGYLQRQLIAYSRSSVVGILGSAIVFGAGHSYKGGSGALRIVLFGALFGILAYWRKSVRPGMIAHAFTDGFAGVLARMLGVRVG